MKFRQKAFIYFNIIIFGFWGIIIFLGIMPKNPIMVNEKFKTEICAIFPERWCFFTKNPKDNYMYILQKNADGSYHIHPNYPNSAGSNLFGLLLKQRAIGLEYGMITSKIDRNLWSKNTSGKSLMEILKNDSSKIVKTRVYSRDALLKGEFVFVEIEPVPFMWKNKIKQFEMPSKYIKIKIIGNE